ncbi:MAG: hypothetical protein F4Z74_06560 [Acidobacteria bacterium]|nr:hypothetical protein [Acidobacteriota bacterium]
MPLCESRWAFNVDRGSAPTLYSPQVFLSAEASQAEKAIHGSFVTVMLWFDLPFPDRPEYGGQRAEGDWVGVRATYYDRVYDENRDSIPWGRVTGNVIDLDLGWLPSQGWPDAWGRPDLDWMTPPHVPFAVELRREVSGADSRLDMPLLCAGAVPGGSP